MITLIKLGGSLITDKTQERTYRHDVMERLAQELQTVFTQSDTQIIIGHGSGSFGHFEAKRRNTINGVYSPMQWQGFAQVAHVARELNYKVIDTLLRRNLPALAFQPSSISLANDGKILSMSLENLQYSLEKGMIPIVYGDVAFDKSRGGTILSTETIFDYLVANLPVNRIILLGEVDGVWDLEYQIIPKITPSTFENMKHIFDGASGVDVTGGMYAKVAGMLTLIQQNPALKIQIVNGTVPNLLVELVLNDNLYGTSIQSD